MAWQEVEVDLGAGGAGRVKYSVALKRGGARLSVPAALVAQLGWTSDTRFRLLVGSGDLDGKLRLEPKDGGAISARKPTGPKGGQGLIIRLGKWPQLAPRDVDAVKVDSEIHDDALTIRLPEHARAVAPAPRVAAAPVPTERRTVSVNDRFFNDPKKPPAMAAGTRK